jgi:hypothetical protein
LAGKLAKGGDGFTQAFGVELGVEANPVHVGWHDDECVGSQVLLTMAEVEAFCNDQTGFLSDEDGQPVDD